MREPYQTPHVSVADYLRAEARSSIRHEYVRGEVYAMPGGTFRHNLITGNIFARLKAAARGGACRVYMNDVKVQPGSDVFYYPDVVAVCGPQDLSDVVATSPCLIAEVTSRSTARIDRGEKLVEYRGAQPLRAYLIVDQNRKRVVHHWRQPTGEWTATELLGSGTIALPCPRLDLSLDEIYEDVELPPLGVAEPELDEETGEYVVERTSAH